MEDNEENKNYENHLGLEDQNLRSILVERDDNDDLNRFCK